jgi:nitrogen regulatory protein PII
MDFAIYRRIEIFCDDSLADELVAIINKTACTGLRGDGKIYVLDVTKAYKIGKGEIT